MEVNTIASIWHVAVSNQVTDGFLSNDEAGIPSGVIFNDLSTGPGVSVGSVAGDVFDFDSFLYKIRVDCLGIVPGWSSMVLDSLKDIEVTVLDPGLSNVVYRVALVSAGDVEYRSVLYRRYSSSVFHDRAVDEEGFRIASDFGIGPKLIGFGSGFRIEQFYEGYSVLRVGVVTRSLCWSIASRLGQLHRVQDRAGFPAEFKARPPASVHRLTDWKRQALLVPGYVFPAGVLEGVDALVDTLKAANPSSLGFHKVFSHNDVSFANILTNAEGDVRLIDFVFTDMNFQGCDLAKFLVQFDSASVRRDFLMEYIAEYFGFAFVPPELLAQLEAAMQTFFLEYNLLWGLWSVVRSLDIGEFDFANNAKLRFETYLSLVVDTLTV